MTGGKTETGLETVFSLVCVGLSFRDLCGALWSKYMGVQCTLLFLYPKFNQKLAVET